MNHINREFLGLIIGRQWSASIARSIAVRTAVSLLLYQASIRLDLRINVLVFFEPFRSWRVCARVGTTGLLCSGPSVGHGEQYLLGGSL